MQLNTLSQQQYIKGLQSSSLNAITRNHAEKQLTSSPLNSAPANSTDTVTISDRAKNMDQAKDIMTHYDLSQISHNDFNKMSDELRNAGAMTDQQYLWMTRPGNNMEGFGELKDDANQPIDMIARFEEMLSMQKQHSVNPAFINKDEKRLDLLKFFGSL